MYDLKAASAGRFRDVGAIIVRRWEQSRSVRQGARRPQRTANSHLYTYFHISKTGHQYGSIDDTSTTTFENMPGPYILLAFTRPKASREVGPLNLTQEHKSVWYGPPSKAMGHAPLPVCDWPVPKSDLRPARRHMRELGPHAIAQATSQRSSPVGTVAREDFLEIGHFAPFSQFLHIKGRNFPKVFISSRLPMPLWTIKSFTEIGPYVFEKSGRQTHRHTDKQTRQLYIYRCHRKWSAKVN